MIAIYVGLALALSWALQIPAIAMFGLDSGITRGVFVAVMWSPTLLAIAFMIFHAPARRGVLWRLGRFRDLPLGIAVETLVGFAVVAILLLGGLAASGWFIFTPSEVVVRGGPWVLGLGAQQWPFYILNVALTAIAYSIFGLIATTGEEFAWRGFLQGHLIDAVGIHRAILTIAAIWWVWHLPGLLAGYDFPQTPILGALILFPLQMLGTSIFFGWLTLRSGSFWPAALAHAAVNSIQQGIISNLEMPASTLAVDLTRTALIVLVGGACWPQLRKLNLRGTTAAPSPGDADSVLIAP